MGRPYNNSLSIKLGARLGGATKELLPNLDTYKNNEKSSIPLRFLFLGGCFGEANLLIFVRPSVRPCRRPPVKIQIVIGVFFGTKNQDTSPDTFCAEPPQNARSSPLVKIPVEGLDCKKYHRPVRWPKIPTEGLDCAKTQKNTELSADRPSTSKRPKLTADRASTSKAPELTAEWLG